MSDLKQAAQRALAALDLTNLEDDCTAEDVRDLCARASTPHGTTAAVCIWPKYVSVAKTALSGGTVRIATVVAFPGGDGAAADIREMTGTAVSDGADEIDMVIPYKALIEGQSSLVPAAVARVKDAAGTAQVKAILETGILVEPDLIRQAATLAVEGGADFIKTSTGKVPVNATPEAARIMLEVIEASGGQVGLKAAGGVRTTQDALRYLDLCDEIMGDGWATPQHFRIGASSLLAVLLATLDGTDAAPAEGY